MAQKITIDVNAKEQQINMIGTDFERTPKFLQKAANPQEIANWAVKDIPYRACRVPYDKQQEMVQGVKNLAYYDDIIASMKMLRIANPDLEFYATMKSDYNGYGKTNNLPDWMYDYDNKTYFLLDEYVQFLADYLELMHSEGLTIKYMTVAKEWTGVITASRTVDIIDGLAVELPKRGVPIPLCTDPSAWGADGAKKFVNSIINLGAAERFHAFSAHWYDCTSSYAKVLTRFTNFSIACNNANAYAWNDESGYGQDGSFSAFPDDISSLFTVYSRRCNMYEAGIHGELFFEICSRGQAGENRSIYFTEGMKGVRNITYYVGKKFAENIYMHNYVKPVNNSLASEVYSMSFVTDSMVALWVVNGSTNNYNSLGLAVNNATINGRIDQFDYSMESIIQGDYTLVEKPASGGLYVNVPARTLSCILIHLDEAASESDVLSTDQDELAFGSLDLKSRTSMPNDFSKEILLNVENASSDITATISGADASSFTIVENSSIAQAPLVWFRPVKIAFAPTTTGSFKASLDITSGAVTTSIPISASSYSSGVYNLAFQEGFPNVYPSLEPITSAVFNSFSNTKGWKVNGGISCVNGRVRLPSRKDGSVETPEISFDGTPVKVTFSARMLQGDIGDDDATKTLNNSDRNFYAVIGNDTVYDHHKAGATQFNTFKEWSFTYLPEAADMSVKFCSYNATNSVWDDLTDGLEFRLDNSKVSVAASSDPAINMAYSSSLDLGRVLVGESVVINYNVKAQNLGAPLFFNDDESNLITVAPSGVLPSSGAVDKDARITIDASILSLGHYTDEFIVSGTDAEIGERTVKVSFDVVSTLASSVLPESKISVIVNQGHVEITTETPSEVMIYNLKGQMLVHQKDKVNFKFALSRGVYVVKVGTQVKKIII